MKKLSKEDELLKRFIDRLREMQIEYMDQTLDSIVNGESKVSGLDALFSMVQHNDITMNRYVELLPFVEKYKEPYDINDVPKKKK